MRSALLGLGGLSHQNPEALSKELSTWIIELGLENWAFKVNNNANANSKAEMKQNQHSKIFKLQFCAEKLMRYYLIRPN